MATFDDFTSSETWAFRSTFETSWFSEAFARDTEVLTKALAESITHGSNDRNVSVSETPSPFQLNSVSSSGGSDDPEAEPETASVSKRGTTPARNVSGAARKISKRKSRASKRSTTTFITADPANFREMVQQVTGVGFGLGPGGPNAVLKPEPQRVGLATGLVARLQSVGPGGYLLPTLDTSAFLLDHHHNQVAGPSNGGGSGAHGFGPNTGEGGGPEQWRWKWGTRVRAEYGRGWRAGL